MLIGRLLVYELPYDSMHDIHTKVFLVLIIFRTLITNASQHIERKRKKKLNCKSGNRIRNRTPIRTQNRAREDGPSA
jgi:hypothetical protein